MFPTLVQNSLFLIQMSYETTWACFRLIFQESNCSYFSLQPIHLIFDEWFVSASYFTIRWWLRQFFLACWKWWPDRQFFRLRWNRENIILFTSDVVEVESWFSFARCELLRVMHCCFPIFYIIVYIINVLLQLSLIFGVSRVFDRLIDYICN